MFKKILISNRSEIAVRVIRACREMGIKSVAVYSEADRESLHTRLADEAVCIGPGPSRLSYLNKDAILAAAKMTGADAIHPGYGFLSENADFADAVQAAGLTFIGPTGAAMRMLGLKSAGKAAARAADVPVVPGTPGLVDEAYMKNLKRNVIEQIGFPVMIKASAGGGGKGMRLVHDPEQIEAQLKNAQAEAQASFNDSSVLIEKFVEQPRHVEIQIACDQRGNVVALPERDCTVQRRHQKLIEESPSPVVPPETRRAMQEAAIRLAKKCNYTNVGTVEFLYDKHGKFYFLEVNTRLQVEHPVTETVTGLDLVVAMILAAAGEKLPFDQARAGEIRCHSIEHRINAEDPDNNFAPCPGRIESLLLPGGAGVRIDTHIYQGYTVPSYYDSLLAKLITSAPDRAACIERSLRALGELEIGGINTTASYHAKVLRTKEFRSGHFDTSLVDQLQAQEKAAAEARLKLVS
jgi:acetyl-CoA carboxylase biotin carboxylase subunit